MSQTQPAGAELPPEQSSPHGLGNRAGRLAWGIAYLLLFRPSPRPLHFWRNLLLRLFGAKLDPTARVYPRCRVWAPWNLVMGPHSCLADDVDCYCVRTIAIGENSTVSQYSYLCGATHDHADARQPLVPMPIMIGARCWIAADVFVAPGVTIGDGTVVGARSSVFRDLPPWVVAHGTPARPVGPRRLGAPAGPEEALDERR
jgi:putative colanic acid biosynthesis acetyltransferase WcaF